MPDGSSAAVNFDLSGSQQPGRPHSAIIRTPDQRLRVFVSSTLQEVAEERMAAREAITKLRLAPVMFELGARPHPPRELYRAYLDQSHIFIGIYWQRYGWVAPGESISGLEDEYRLSGNRPKLIYIKSPAPEREPRLTELLERVQQDDRASYKYFTTAAELRDLIENDLALLLTESFETTQIAEAPPVEEVPAPVASHPNNLLMPPTPLVGREKDMIALRDLLLRDDVRLVSLSGPGGVGKSRLALELARDQLARYEGGVFFVTLAGITDPGHMISAMAQTLGVREASERPLMQSLKDYLRNKHILLVLDNFEQVVAAAQLVTELLESSSQLEVIVTTRTPLHVRGENRFIVAPLALPDRQLLPSAVGAQFIAPLLSRYAAVQLFVQRAQAVRADFALTEENAGVIAEICRRLDGLPLAIELAAARVKYQSPPALLARLEKRLTMLTGGARDLPARQQTLRDTIDWSYNLLDEGAKRLFRRLAVFIGGWSLEAAEAICHTDGDANTDVLEEMETLVDSGLLKEVEDADGEPRFGVLETIREYALEQLATSGEALAMRREHANYFYTLAEQAEPHLMSARRNEWLARLEREHENLRAALAWTLAEAGRETGSLVGLRLAGALSWFWYHGGYYSEGREWLERALVRSGIWGLTARAKALFGAGIIADIEGDWATARARLEESVALWRQLQSAASTPDVSAKRSLAYALTFLQQDLDREGEFAQAQADGQESVAIFREIRDEDGLALALSHLGILTLHQGDLAAARALFEESLALWRRSGDKENLTAALRELGHVLWLQDDHEAARRHYEESLAVARELGDKRQVIWALHWLGSRVYSQGDFEQAASLFYESLALAWELGYRHAIASSLSNLGDIDRSQGDYEKAALLYEQSLTLFRELDHKQGIASLLFNLARVAQAQGEARRAMSLYKESLEIYGQLGLTWSISECLVGVAGVAQARGQPERAARLFGAAEALRGSASMDLMSPANRVEYERSLEATRAQMDEGGFAAAWAAGKVMTVEQALALALEEPGYG